MPINYVVGDATDPPGPADGAKDSIIIVQCCNDVGAYGAGFSGAIARRYPVVEEGYRHWFKTGYDIAGNKQLFELGGVYFVAVQAKNYEDGRRREATVANIIGQRGIRSSQNPYPIDYAALRKGLERIEEAINAVNEFKKGCLPEVLTTTTVHMPRTGCGLAGGDWAVVEKIINETLIDKGVSVTVYDLKE